MENSPNERCEFNSEKAGKKQTNREAGDVSTSHEELRGVRKCLPLTFPSGRRRAIHAEASTINKESPETEASAFFFFFFPLSLMKGIT